MQKEIKINIRTSYGKTWAVGEIIKLDFIKGYIFVIHEAETAYKTLYTDYSITELTTGLRIATGSNKDEVYLQALLNLKFMGQKEFDKNFKKSVRKFGKLNKKP